MKKKSQQKKKLKVVEETTETETKTKKKSKKDKLFNGKPVEKVEIEEETGTFKKIFYRPSETTNNMPADEVTKFQTSPRLQRLPDRFWSHESLRGVRETNP